MKISNWLMLHSVEHDQDCMYYILSLRTKNITRNAFGGCFLMTDTRRNQLKEFVEREFIGPDPIDWEGTKQADGDEILSADAPSTRYIAGILFPLMVPVNSESESAQEELDVQEQADVDSIIDTATEELPQNSGSNAEYLEDAEELINRSNAYRQSAMSITVGIMKNDHIKNYNSNEDSKIEKIIKQLLTKI